MAKPEWGVKRTCTSCGARFYDMRRDPIVCPKCDATVDPLAQLRSPRARPAPVPAAEEPAAAVEAVEELEVVEDDELEDSAVETVEEESEEEEILEDASELGEDKDDMFEVMDKVAGDEEETR